MPNQRILRLRGTDARTISRDTRSNTVDNFYLELFFLAIVFPISVVAVVWILPLFVLALIAKRRRLRIYERLTKDITAVGEADGCIPVRYASAERFAKSWKFFPWELCGILHIGHDGATFHTSLSRTGPSLAFDQSASQVSWLGRRFWPNGYFSWVIISMAGKKHYFTSETGTTVLGSKRTTEELYRKLNDCLGEEIS